MKGIIVTIVDIFGIFIPGAFLLLGILFIPSVGSNLLKHKEIWASVPEGLRTNSIFIGSLFVTIAYVLGFILHQFSVSLLHKLTYRKWSTYLQNQIAPLNEVLESALNDPTLCESVRAASGARGKGKIVSYAPYFHFARRIIRIGHPALLSESERLEAELRFSAGLFIPFCVLFVDGVALAFTKSVGLGALLATISLFSATSIYIIFPGRREREVLYIYYLALVALKFKPVNPSSKEE